MTTPLIWLHEEALRVTHPVFKAAPAATRTIYVWDDAYFRAANYSLKRLVFIYETLSALPIEILHGSTSSAIQTLTPSALFVPATNNPLICSLIHEVQTIAPVTLVQDESFANINKPADFRRFFNYWNKAEKTAFLHDGGLHA